MSQQSVLPALLQRVAPPSLPFVSIISHLLPSFSLSLPSLPRLHHTPPSSPDIPPLPLFHLHLLLLHFHTVFPGGGAAAQTRAVLGFQMVRLAQGSALTPSGADPLLPQTPGGSEGLGGDTLLEQDER